MSNHASTWDKRKRKYRCPRSECRKFAVKAGSYCSRSCSRTAYLLTKRTPEQRSAQMRKARAMQQQQEINRMVQRVKALADGEEARLILAWRYGTQAAKARRYRLRLRAEAQAAPGGTA